MYSPNTKKHTVDFLFAILLFLLFTASALMVILIGGKVYQSSSSRMEQNYTVRTALSYLTEKIRQSDTSGAIELSHIDGTPALILRQEIDGVSYSTYIYGHDHSLKELFIKSSSPVSPDMGSSIVDLESISMEELEDGFFRLTAVDHAGNSISTLVHPQSRKEETS